MKKYFTKKTSIGISIFCALILLAFSGSHPTTGTGGYTGAPNDNVCTQCHTPGGSLDGMIEVSGLPATVTPNVTYPLTVTITDTSPGGVAVRAGFQMVSLKANLANAGTFVVPGSESNASVKTVAGKSYVGHQPAKNFDASDLATFDVEWTAPSSATGDITLYAASMITNGANGNSNDKFVVTSLVTSLEGTSDPLSATFSNVSDATCSDASDGAATVNATGGSGGYSYAWDNGESNATAVMLNAGTHDVTITDDSNASITESVVIGAPNEIDILIISMIDAECNNTATGSAEVVASGGTPNFLYDWGNGIFGSIQNNLSAGIYNITVTDVNNCTSTQELFIGEPDPITITTLTTTEPTCNGESDGALVVEASGGNGGFTYNWLTGGVGTPVDGSIIDLPAGDYTVEVFDIEGCNTTTQLSLGEPSAVSVTVSSTPANCFEGADGTATALGAGGTGTFTYLWSTGATSSTASDLIAGTYAVTATDANGCEIIETIDISQPATAVSSSIAVNISPNCGNTDGEIEASGNDGTPGYTFEWTAGTNPDIIGTSAILGGISSGIYNALITDANGCTSTSQVTLTDADGVSLAANDVINATCFGGNNGSATITPSSSSDIFTYEWSNGGTNPTESNLAAGFYTIVVMDGNGCSGEIIIEITEPSEISAPGLITNISCNGANDGSITITPEGGTGNITALWNIGSTDLTIENLVPGLYSVVLTDENDCAVEVEYIITEPLAISAGEEMITLPSCPGNSDGSIEINATGGTGDLVYTWNNGSNDSIISNLSAGDYDVTITDANDCSLTFAFTLDDPNTILATALHTMPTCSDASDGSIILDISGGSGGYVTQWDNGQDTLENVAAGEYIVTITDSNSCSIIDTFVLEGPIAIDPNVTAVNETENGAGDGSASSDPLNGEAPYSYLWSNDETTAAIENLSPGNFTVTVTDSNGCTATQTVVINSGDCMISAMTNITNVSCADSLDGAIDLVLTGAVDPLTYQWSNEETSAALSNLAAGIYSVTIVDANDCQIQITDILVEEPNPIEIVLNEITPASGPNAMDGKIDISLSGGTGDITILISDLDAGPLEDAVLDSLSPGFYGIFATDENGCTVLFGPYTVDFLTSIKDISIEANIFPNPANQSFTIETNTPLDEAPVMFAVSGQQVRTQISTNGNSYTVNTDFINAGVYYVKLISNNKVELKKVLIGK